MKQNNPLFIAFLMLFSSAIFAQNNYEGYGEIEKRFEKSDLSHQDSLAFIETGKQKAYTLIEYAKVHYSNTNNMSNQAYIVNRVPDLFYVAEGETLNSDSIVMVVRAIIQKELPDNVELIFTDKEGVLSHVETAFSTPKFEADIILIKRPKKFGKTNKEVWQVFLTRPKWVF